MIKIIILIMIIINITTITFIFIFNFIIICRANINSTNNGTLWTPLHCAAFQGHGRVIMTLMEHQPDIHKVDSEGR